MHLQSYKLFGNKVLRSKKICKKESKSLEDKRKTPIYCNYGLRYLLACMNSKVVDFYYKKKFSTKKTDAFPEIQTYLYEQLPIPTVSDNVQSNIESLVDDILNANKNETSTTEMEQEIDRIVYHLYGLTYDEVLIIDPTPPFTQEEYEQDNL